MRLDLHNHTIIPKTKFHKFDTVLKQYTREIYFYIVKTNQIDGIAITNLHDIEIALSLWKKFSEYIIIGAEYKILCEEGNSVYITVLNIDEDIHKLLMKAKFRGVQYFTNLLKEKNFPYFISHVGLGLSLEHSHICELFDSFFSCFNSIDVLDHANLNPDSFMIGLSKYYDLGQVAGSGHLLSRLGRRVYTEVNGAQNINDFFEGFHKKNVNIGFTDFYHTEQNNTSSIWQLGKDFISSEIQKLWQTELGINKQLDINKLIENFSKTILLPALQNIPYDSHLNQLKIGNKRLNFLKSKFVDYLKLTKTKQIFSGPEALEEKKQNWKQSISKINKCFSI